MSIAVEPLTIVAGAAAGLAGVLDPDAGDWAGAAEHAVALEHTPLERQPSAYVQVAWERRPRGLVREVRVRAVAAADGAAVRLDWAAPRPVPRIDDWNVYADACAVLFPADGRSADLATMGGPDAPVRGWHWRAGADGAFSFEARGLGTVTRDREHAVQAQGRWDDGRWAVVLARPFAAAGVPLAAGAAVPVGFAVWSGAAKERAGLKSYSPAWHELRLGA